MVLCGGISMRLTKKNGIGYIPRHQFRDYNAVLNDIELKQAYQHATDKLGLLEDVIEDIVNWTDGRIEQTDTIIITFKSSEKLMRLLDEL